MKNGVVCIIVDDLNDTVFFEVTVFGNRLPASWVHSWFRACTPLVFMTAFMFMFNVIIANLARYSKCECKCRWVGVGRSLTRQWW